MDPVNKWLTVIISFMIALLIVISYKAGSGRYSLAVSPSESFPNHAVVYILDTKSGDVYVKLIDEDEMQYNGTVKHKAQKLMEIPSSSYRSRGY